MKKSMIILIPVLLASCTLGPTTVTRTSPNGAVTEVTTAGATIFTTNDYEKTIVENGNFKAYHEVYKKDEIGLPRWSAAGSIAESTASVTNTAIKAVAPAINPD